MKEADKLNNKEVRMENNDISLEIYVKDQKLNKNDYELICSALKENKNI